MVLGTTTVRRRDRLINRSVLEGHAKYHIMDCQRCDLEDSGRFNVALTEEKLQFRGEFFRDAHRSFESALCKRDGDKVGLMVGVGFRFDNFLGYETRA